MALYMVFYLQPTTSLGPYAALVGLVVLEIVSVLIGLAVGGVSPAGTVTRILVFSALLAGYATYILSPANAIGFSLTLLDIVLLESIATAVAWGLLFKRK